MAPVWLLSAWFSWLELGQAGSAASQFAPEASLVTNDAQPVQNLAHLEEYCAVFLLILLILAVAFFRLHFAPFLGIPTRSFSTTRTSVLRIGVTVVEWPFLARPRGKRSDAAGA